MGCRLQLLEQAVDAKRIDYLDFPLLDTPSTIRSLQAAHDTFEDTLDHAAYAVAQGTHTARCDLPRHFRADVTGLTEQLQSSWDKYKELRDGIQLKDTERLQAPQDVPPAERPQLLHIVQHDAPGGLVDQVCGVSCMLLVAHPVSAFRLSTLPARAGNKLAP